MSAKFKSHEKEILNDIERAQEQILERWGMIGERFAKEACPTNSGRLKNSITYATKEKHSNGSSPAESEDYAVKDTPKQGEVYIGTNVEYAEIVETSDSMTHTNGRAHFLRDSLAKHRDLYNDEAKKIINSLK